MEQDKLKAVMEYLEKEYFDEQKKLGNAKPEQKKHAVPTATTMAKLAQQPQQPKLPQIVDKIHVMYFDEGNSKGKQITILPRVLTIRPHILCCIVREIDLKTPGNLKKFLNLQNELHDELCQKRTMATIATHDLDLIKGDTLIYDAYDPDEIGLIPLGRQKLITAKEYYDQLCKEAEHERKQKKRNQVSGVHKYLTLLNDEQLFPCLADSERFVISLPPFTNSERTKMSANTTSIMVEVTSGQNLDACKRVMDALLRGMLKIHLGKQMQLPTSPINKIENVNNATTTESKFKCLSLSAEKEEAEEEKTTTTEDDNDDKPKIRQILILQQCRVVEQNGSLKNVYPSRTDLEWAGGQNENIIIERTVE